MAFRLSNWGGRELPSSKEILTLSSRPSHGGSASRFKFSLIGLYMGSMAGVTLGHASR